MIEKELSDHDEDDEEELFQIKGKRKHDDVEEDEEEQEQEQEEDDEDSEDESTKPPAKKWGLICWFIGRNNGFDLLFRRQAKMSNGNSSTPTNDEFLSSVKEKFDRRKDRVKTLSVDDFE